MNTDRIPILTIYSRCSCGAKLFIELREAPWNQIERSLDVAKAWNDAHAKHEVKQKP